MPKTTNLPPKKDVALALLEHSTVFIHLDPRKTDVRVPQWFRKQPQLVLQVGLNMPVPIPDLNLDEEGLSCTLSFNRAPHFCKVPWSAVYALVGESGRGMVWPDDVPAEVAAQAQPAPKVEEKRAHLRSVNPEAAKPAPAKGAAKAARGARGTAGKSEAAKLEKAQAGKLEKKRKRTRRSAEAKPEAKVERAVRNAPRPLPQPVQAAAVSDGEGNGAAEKGEKKKRELPPYLRVVK